METLNHLINNLKEGLYVCGEKQKFERFFGSLSLGRRIKFILRELRNTANVTGSRDVRDTNGALSFAIVLRARITSFPADRNPRKFIERLDPRFSKVSSRDCHLIFKRLILTHNFVLFIAAAFFRSSASKTKSNTKRDSRLKRRGEKKQKKNEGDLGRVRVTNADLFATRLKLSPFSLCCYHCAVYPIAPFPE